MTREEFLKEVGTTDKFIGKSYLDSKINVSELINAKLKILELIASAGFECEDFDKRV